ncbi:MAG: helix-turn-helix transcriptional regulator [Oligoflexales bacterium]|nr:helix-turn-helix transcriptional regulator [Oligoflexales bacterium]
MSKKKIRTYSNYTKAASTLLSQLIKLGRKQKSWTESELAKRAGITRATLQRIEKGDLKCEIGLVFEVAMLVGIKFFHEDLPALTTEIHRISDTIALLPKSVRKREPGNFDENF